ncbi:G-protein coupled receptor 161-like [Babylonia areolata]|uniref:G-protein coupled receptor 161-like n=1 Tax=Babylonia areolata TaxID=304850 RepID=UPI003FD14803
MTRTEVTLLATILVTVFLCSAVANSLVCVVFSKRRRSLSLSNRFLANLTVCNCLFTLLIMPFAFVSLLSRQWLFGEVLCQLTGLVINVLVTASIFTLVVVSLDRYCAVVTPLHYNMRMTRRRCWAFIGGIWAGALAVSAPPLMGWSGIKFHVNKMICTVAWDSEKPGARYYTLFLVTVSFVVPLVAMLWTYGCIFRAARDNSERTRRSSIVPTVQADSEGGGSSGSGSGSGLQQSTPINKRRSSSVPIIRRLSQTSSRSNSILQRREEWKTAVTSFLILFSFMLCWLPYFIVICLRSLAPSLRLHPVMSTISTVAAMFGCACNPMVYVFRSKGTRHDLKVILTRRRSYRNEIVQTAFRRGGSMRGGAGGGGEGGGREKGSVFWQEELLCHPGELPSKFS